MATLAPHSPQPIPSSSRSPSPTPAPSYITYSKSEPDFQDDHDTIPLTGRGGIRSGSPTPSEKIELRAFEGTSKKIFRKESWKDRQFVITMVVVTILIAITIVIAVFQDKIIEALVPAAEWVYKAPAGWLIPIVILIILSIPPLFGAEIIHILAGFTYGLWIGFLITCAGMVIGECITFYMFRSCLRSRAEKMEKGTGGGSPRFGALARVIREGGFWVTLVIRFSAFPTHITTALFATCGVSFFMFLLTLVLSLPRQLAGVYIGVLAKQKAEGHTSTQDKVLSNVILGITIAITVAAMIWIQSRLKTAALAIIRERRARENAADNLEIKPFNPRALYDPDAGNNQVNADAYFGTRTPSPAPPHAPSGAMMPAQPAPAQIHVESSIV
ncbi:Golgi apparatus membrane protein TVP38 [Ceratobasidium sp. AG-Ba]|nr:Golgi apparatus membrane protein TVP38 [Ceratobasidium sp. AG-Ba]QRW10750.1 Golgi apparatus membrane protein TVP38 [Ceratobasidium sp. AG-Ba]